MSGFTNSKTAANDTGKFLVPLIPKSFKGNNDVLVLDIETWGLEPTPQAFALGVVYSEQDGKEKSVRFTSPDEMRDYLTSRRMRGKKVFAHNGGRYDYLAIFGKLQTAINALYSGSKYIQGWYALRNYEYKGKEKAKEKVMFYDSLNVLSVSVEELGRSMGLPKGQTPDKFKVGDRSGGIQEEDFLYCIQDCRIVYKALCGFFDLIGKVKPTVASSALAYYRTYHQPRTFRWDAELDHYFRSCYCGGRVEVQNFNIDPFAPQYKYDINSLYPFVMSFADYPHIETLKLQREPPQDRMEYLLKYYEGCAEVELQHYPSPRGYIPFLSDGKLLFPAPTKPFTARVCYPELRKALNSGLVELLRTNWTVYGIREPSPFKSFVESLYKLRLEAKDKKDGFHDLTYKLLMNSCYGKFGEFHDEKSIYSEKFDEDLLYDLQGSGAVSWCPISAHREDGYYKVQIPAPQAATSHTIFAYAAYTTSWARAVNMGFQEQIAEKGGILYYTDTDSFVTNVPLPAGKQLGMLKLEPKRFVAIYGAKDYVESTLEDVDGTAVLWYGFAPEKQKTKGVPERATLKDGQYVYDTFLLEKQAIRQGRPVGMRYTATKTLKRNYDKGRVMPDGSVLPLDVIA